MKSFRTIGAIVAVGLSVLAKSQSAPPVINYQGRLTQSTGVVVPDGLTGMRVRIFATASGGSALWDSGDLSVATKSGTFSILLGSGGMPTMSPAVFAMGTVYIEVQPTGQAPLLPRQPIASVPWSLYAQTVSDGSIGTTKLANSAVTYAQLANDPLSLSKVSTGLLTVGSTPEDRINVFGRIRLQANNDERTAGMHFSSASANRFFLGLTSNETSASLGVYPTSASNSVVVISQSGQVGIGLGTQPSGDPQAKLAIGGDGGRALEVGHSSGSNWFVRTQSDQDISLYARSFNLIGSASGLLYCTNGTALKPGGGPWADLNSDRRLKTDISPMDNALRMLLSLRGVNYRFKDPQALNERPGMRRGFIAQEVEATFPEWVVTKPNGYKTISFDSGFDALTVEAFREQQNQIEKLRQENEQLRRQNAAFESRLRSIEAKFKR